MPEFRVVYQIDVTANTPEGAAYIADNLCRRAKVRTWDVYPFKNRRPQSTVRWASLMCMRTYHESLTVPSRAASAVHRTPRKSTGGTMGVSTPSFLINALAIAQAAHSGQVRKYTGLPYVTHSINVAGIVSQYLRDDYEAIAAALLHDVVEDTAITEGFLEELFPARVVDLVMEVTEVSRPEDGNREARKKLDRDHYARASSAGQTIKVADLIDNLTDITAHDKDFALVYVREKKLLLGRLDDANPYLRNVAYQVLENAKKQLGVV